MKRLILIRHSKTEIIYDGIGDFERQLKSRGRTDAKLVASHLKRKGFIPQLIVSSFAVRAIQTAEVMSKVFNYPIEKIQKESFLYDGFTTSEFIDFINNTDNSIDTVAVIGHNPEIALTGMNLTDKDFFHFPTTATVIIDYDVDNWKDIEVREGSTKHFVTPRNLKEV